MDWLNLGTKGVTGDLLFAAGVLLRSKYDGFVGVTGCSDVIWPATFCLMARCAGRKIPDPGIDVTK